MVPTVVSGGQTGVDRAALEWALTRGVAVGGWCPRGRLAEDGQLAAEYAFLNETPLPATEQRTAVRAQEPHARALP